MGHEVLGTALWSAHPLGRPIIGTQKTVSSLTRDALAEYMATRYRPDKIVVSAAGNVEHEEMVQLTRSTLGDIEGAAPPRPANSPKPSGKSKQQRKRDAEQVHFCLGSAGYGKGQQERYSLSILNNVLGGNMS